MSTIFIARLFPTGNTLQLLSFSRKVKLEYRILKEKRLLPFAAPKATADDVTPAAPNAEPSATEKERHTVFFTVDMNKDIANSLLLVEFAQRKEVVFGVSSAPELENILREAVEIVPDVVAVDAQESNVPAKVPANPPPENTDVGGDVVIVEAQAAPAESAAPAEPEVKDEEAERAAREAWDSMGRPVTLVKWHNVNNGRPISRPDLIGGPTKRPRLTGNKTTH